MKKERIFVKFKNCIYDMKSLLRYSKDGLSKAIIYIILLNVFLGLIVGTVSAIRINNEISEFKLTMSEPQYEFKINDGQLTLKTDSIKKEYDDIMIYINDSYKLDEKDKVKENLKYKDQYILLLKDGIAINIVDYNLIGYNINYTDIIADGLSNEDIISSLNLVSIVSIPICIIYTIINGIIDCLIVSVFVAFITKAVISFMGIRKRFEELYTITLYSSTFSLIVFVVIPAIIMQFSLLIGLMFGAVIYNILVINFEKKEEIQ